MDIWYVSLYILFVFKSNTVCHNVTACCNNWQSPTDKFCFNHAPAFYTSNNIVKNVDEKQIRGTNSNRKSYWKLPLPNFGVTCFKHVMYFSQSVRSIESRCMVRYVIFKLIWVVGSWGIFCEIASGWMSRNLKNLLKLHCLYTPSLTGFYCVRHYIKVMQIDHTIRPTIT